QHLGKLLAQPDLHLVLGGINTVLRQAAGLDITVQDDHFVPALGNLLRGNHAGRSRAYHEDGLHLGSLQNRRATAQSRYFPLISSVLLLPVVLLSLTIRTHA